MGTAVAVVIHQCNRKHSCRRVEGLVEASDHLVACHKALAEHMALLVEEEEQ